MSRTARSVRQVVAGGQGARVVRAQHPHPIGEQLLGQPDRGGHIPGLPGPPISGGQELPTALQHRPIESSGYGSRMDLEPGYNLPESTVRLLVMLDWIYDAVERQSGEQFTGNLVMLTDLFDDQAQADKQTTAAELRDAKSQGWLILHESLGFGGWSGVMTPEGSRFVESVRGKRADLVGRRRAARDAVLRWLYDCKASGQRQPDISGFALTGYLLYFGLAFTDQELTDATAWLLDSGYINGQKAWGGLVPRPAITPKGESVVESRRSVNDDANPTVSADAPGALNITITDSKNVNFAANSPGASQSMTLSEDNRKQVLAVADAFEVALPLLGLNDEQTRESAALIRDLKAISAEPAPDPSRLRQVLDKAASIAIAGTGTAIGAAIASLAMQAIQGLG